MATQNTAQNTPPAEGAGVIDITPTWPEWGSVYRRLAESGEKNAVRELREDFAKAMASAQALRALKGTLTEEQAKLISNTLTAELSKQGY